jgi:hypothetical protein
MVFEDLRSPPIPRQTASRQCCGIEVLRNLLHELERDALNDLPLILRYEHTADARTLNPRHLAGTRRAGDNSPVHPFFLLEMPIELLGLGVWSYNRLKGEKVETVGQLMSLTERDLLRIRCSGKACLADVKGRLARYQQALRIDENRSSKSKSW